MTDDAHHARASLHPRGHPRQLVTFDTQARDIRHVSTKQLIRDHVTYVTSQPRETPAEPSPREMRATTTSTNAARMNSRPLGELGGSSTSCSFCTANGGVFERPRAAFFTVVAAVVMPCMTVGMVGTMRRKTRFLTGVTDRHTQAKPTAVTTAFCILVSPCLELMIVIFAAVPLMFLLR